MPGQRARASRALPSLALLSLLLTAILAAAGPTWGAPAAQQAARYREAPFPPPAAGLPPPLAATGTLKAFIASADTEVQSGNPSANFGIEPFLGAGFDTDPYRPPALGPSLERRALFNFSVAPFLPPGTVIHSATLRLYQGGYCGRPTDGPFQLFRIAEDWSELRATWDSQPATDEGYAPLTVGLGTGWLTFDLSGLVRDWVSGASPEYGVMLLGPSASPDCAMREYRSKGGGGFTSRPTLQIDYTLPTPTLTTSAGTITFERSCGQPLPAAQDLVLRSTGTEVSDWSIAATGGDGWLTLDKRDGQITHIFPDRVGLAVGEGAPCPGTVTATLELSAPGLASPQPVSVTFRQVSGPGELKVPRAYLPAVARSATSLSSAGLAGSGQGAGLAGSGQGAGLAGSGQAAGLAATEPRAILLVGISDYQYLGPPTTFALFGPGAVQDDLGSGEAPIATYIAESRRSGRDCASSTSYPAALSAGSLATVCSLRIHALTESNATQPKLSLAFKRMAEFLKLIGGRSVVVISGHGGQAPDRSPIDEADQREELVAPYEVQLQPQLADYISDDELSALIGTLPGHVTVLFDTCNSGGMEIAKPERAVLAASREDQASWETFALENGVASHFFLQALIDPASDLDHDGWVSVSELYTYARDKVSQYVLTNMHAQQNLVLDLPPGQDRPLLPVLPR